MVCAYPSGSDLATAAAPIVPPAPDFFSTIIDWPSSPDSCSNTVRGTMSEALPAVNGPIARIGFVGHVRPNAEAFATTAATLNPRKTTLIRCLLKMRYSIFCDLRQEAVLRLRPPTFEHERHCSRSGCPAVTILSRRSKAGIVRLFDRRARFLHDLRPCRDLRVDKTAEDAR
jgi:hypothetical protein